MNNIIKQILSGFKSFLLKPKLWKLILFGIGFLFLKFLLQTNKEDPNIIYMGMIFLIVPGFFFFLGSLSKIDDEESKSFKKKKNQLQVSNQNEYIQNDYNDHEIVDRVERRTITTNKTEIIETIYFLDGHPYKQKQTYYFKGDD